MADVVERTISATEFKAKCLELMDMLADRRLDRVVVTKRGRTVAVMQPPPPVAEGALPAIFGCMKDWPAPVPTDHDWQKPLYSDVEMDRYERRLARKFRRAFRGRAPAA